MGALTSAIALAFLTLPPAIIEARGGSAREPRLPFVSTVVSELDRMFMQHMATHHDAGVSLARSALASTPSPEPAALARLVIAEQTREAALLRNWWRSWFGTDLPELPADHVAMVHGIPSAQEVARLRQLSGQDADRLFLRLIRQHHRGAVEMSDEAWSRAGDPRLRTFAYSVRHAQSGQIRWIDALLATDPSRLARPRESLMSERRQSRLRSGRRAVASQIR